MCVHSIIYRGLAPASDISLPVGGANGSNPDMGVVVMKPLLLIVPGVGKGESMGGIEDGGGTVRGLASKKLGREAEVSSGLVLSLGACRGLCDTLGVACCSAEGGDGEGAF